MKEVKLEGKDKESRLLPEKFKNLEIYVQNANRDQEFGPVPRGFKRVVFLQNMAGPKIRPRRPGMVVDITKDEAKVLKDKRNYQDGWPVIADCPRTRGKFNDKLAYHITESIHQAINGCKMYSGIDSFRNVKNRR